jgi:hypothetical protein
MRDLLEVLALKGKRRRDSDVDDTVGEPSGSVGTLGRRQARYERHQQMRLEKPIAALQNFKEWAALKLSKVGPREKWTYLDVWATVNLQERGAAGRMGWVLAETCELDAQRESEELIMCTVVRGLQGALQFAADGGSWKTAWALGGQPEPYDPVLGGGAENHLYLFSNMRRAKEVLAELGQNSSSPGAFHAGAFRDAEESHAIEKRPKGVRQFMKRIAQEARDRKTRESAAVAALRGASGAPGERSGGRS